MRTLQAEIAQWAQTRPYWQRIVLGRLARGENLNEPDYLELADRIIKGHFDNVSDPGLPDTWSLKGDATQVSLAGIMIGENVNGLQSGQSMEFPVGGLTVVYGDNGSGKSGYARLLKHFFSSRVSDDVLPNIFADATGDKPKAQVAILADSSRESTMDWTQQPQQFSHVGFFDKGCSNDYLTRDSEVTYRPRELSLLTRLIEVCDEVTTILHSRLLDNGERQRQLPEVSQSGNASRFLDNLSVATTLSQIDEACLLEDGYAQKIAKLQIEETTLQNSNPEQERKRLVDRSAQFTTLAEHLSILTTRIGRNAVGQAEALSVDAAQLRQAATAMSAQQFSDEPLNGVGTAAWRALWEAARAFSQEEAYPPHAFPHLDDDARCVLCQQALRDGAKGRLARFDSYVRDQTEQRAATAETAAATALSTIMSTTVIPAPIADALARLESDYEDIVTQYRGHLTNFGNTLQLLSDEESTGEPGWSETGQFETYLRDEATSHKQRASAIDSSVIEQQLRQVISHRQLLDDQVSMVKGKVSIHAEVMRLQEEAAIRAAIAATATAGITNKVRNLNREFISTAIKDRFQEETSNLRLTRVTLYDKGGQKGKLMNMPGFVHAKQSAPLTKVLSEGEQTALGLAGFFTEAYFDESRSSLILDDPVSSLDHKRREYVANRIAEFSNDRQVIVFTHDLTFVAKLKSASTDMEVEFTERAVELAGDGTPGICTDEHPWRAKDVRRRLGELKNDLASIESHWSSWTQKEREARSADWSGKLSETLEQAISVEIAAKVYDPSTLQVKPLMFRLFGRITEEDDKEFQRAYGKISGWARRHNLSMEENDVGPEPVDLAEQLTWADDWFSRMKRYWSQR